MSASLIRTLSEGEIEAVEREVGEEAEAGREEAAWAAAQPLRQAQSRQREAAEVLLEIIGRRWLPMEGGVEALSEIAEAYHRDADLMALVGECLEAVRDIDDLNSAPPADALFYTVVERLAALARECAGQPEEEAVLGGLGVAARLLGRQRDDLAEASCRRLTELDPGKSAHHYDLGLFCKTRGRFAEGVEANRKAASLVDEAVEPYEWNLGICATGAGMGEVALDVWKRMGLDIELGRFGLPEGGFRHCKVKLAERPLAERGADDDSPGLEETVWIERLSPCHGVIRSVLYAKLGVDYGDVILMDGAPITFQTYGDVKVPVFPHLATLARRGYQFHDFAGTQEERGQLAGASVDLEGDAILYSHSENVQVLCATCWRDQDLDHERHERVEKHVVIGRIAAPAHIGPAQLLEQIDRALAKRSPCKLYAPDLCAAAGYDERARIERRRFDLLRNN